MRKDVAKSAGIGKRLQAGAGSAGKNAAFNFSAVQA